MLVLNLMNGGYFVINENLPDEIKIKNTWVKDGATLALQDLFQQAGLMADPVYIGLTNASYTFDSASLVTIAAGEPTGNGYARIALNRDNVDWTVQEINGIMQAKSKSVTFTASADWDKAWVRAFLCDQAAGTAGLVYAVSGPASAARTVLSGAGPTVSYEFWMRG